MEEVKTKKRTKSKSKTSSISASSTNKKRTRKQLEKMQVDSDLLFEEIMKKKQIRQEKRRLRELSKQEKMNLSSDELFELIMEQKKAKKAKKPIVTDKDNVVSEIVQEIVNEDIVQENQADNLVDGLLKKTDDVDEYTTQVVQTSEVVFDDSKLEKTEYKTFNLKFVFTIFLSLIIGVIFGIAYDRIVDKRLDTHEVDLISENLETIEVKVETIEDTNLALYNACLAEKDSGTIEIDEIQQYINELNDYFDKKYRTSIVYEDLTSGFKYVYNENVQYYAASTIKALGALYIYTKADNGEISLDETMTYSSRYKYGSSKGMSKHKFGDKVTLRELVYHSVAVSDNSAHQMLVDYIGFSNLKAFGKSLGATYTLIGGDNFGSISAVDGVIYMKALNEFFESSELGTELRSYFMSAEQNDLSISDLNILAAHKYGEYDMYYHDIGIVYDEFPYVIAILTKEGNKYNFEEIVRDINLKIYELHRLYNDTRKNSCRISIYGK